ncbi:MAG: hypothetical protein ACM3US_14435 [Sphingomonadaceae bacterium]
MLLDRPKEEIARDLFEHASRAYGPERAETLRTEIDRVADWISLIAPIRLEIDADEPDFVVAPAGQGEVR